VSHLCSDCSIAAAAADNKLSGNWEAILKLQLRNLTKAGKLVKPAGKNTYKLGEALKKAPKKKPVGNESLDFLVDVPSSYLSFRLPACLTVLLLSIRTPACTNIPICRLQAAKKATATKAKKPAAKKTAAKKAPAKPKAETKAETKAEGDAAAPAAAKPKAKKASAAKPKAKGVAAKPKAMAKKGAAVKKAKVSFVRQLRSCCMSFLAMSLGSFASTLAFAVFEFFVLKALLFSRSLQTIVRQ